MHCIFFPFFFLSHRDIVQSQKFKIWVFLSAIDDSSTACFWVDEWDIYGGDITAMLHWIVLGGGNDVGHHEVPLLPESRIKALPGHW